MRQADSRRLDRLAGDGNSEAGINLASLFRVILDQVQDSTDGISAEDFTGPVKDAVSNHARVEHWYGAHAADPWAALISDALEQMESRKLIARDGDRWRTGPDFATGKRLIVVPARKGKHGQVGVIPHDLADREALGVAEQQRMEVTSLAASLREDGPGLRPLDADHLKVLEQSMRDYGYRPEFPVLVDQHGRILDGRHRIAAARRAGIPEPVPERKVVVASDAEAVGFAILVNLQRGWTKAERGRIDSDLRAAGLTTENYGQHLGAAAKRELIRTTLLEQAALEKPLSHNAIAKRLNVHPMVVNRECESLITQCVIREPCPHRFTEDGKEAPGPKPKTSATSEPSPRKMDDPALRAEIRRQLSTGVHGKDIRQSELCDLFGVGQYVVAQAVAAETELFLREQLPSEAAADTSADAPPPPAHEYTPRQAPSPPPAFEPAPPPAAPEPQPEPGPAPAPIDYGDMIRHLQAIADLEPDRIIADLAASGDHATAMEVYEWADRARDITENLTELLERGESYEQEEELGEDVG